MTALAETLATDVAALFVDARGSYPSRVVEWFDQKRDARTYSLSLPVVAHPPCQRWCRLAGMVEARWGHKRGEDDGCFASALSTLRRVGGVLEHPAFSDAWKAFDLPRPPSGGGWVPGADLYEWTCYVEQFRYGHRAKKATWLYYVGATKPFDLRWGLVADRTAAPVVSWTGNKGATNWRDNVRAPSAVVSYMTNHGGGGAPDLRSPSAVVGRAKHDPNDRRPRLTKKQASATPPEFLDTLIALARHSQAEP